MYLKKFIKKYLISILTFLIILIIYKQNIVKFIWLYILLLFVFDIIFKVGKTFKNK